jgi:hypothetical protein
MVKHGQHDTSPGDARRPFSDEGGPEGRHAQTHDVRREEVTRPKGKTEGDDFDADLRAAPPTESPDQTLPARTDHELKGDFADLTSDELARLPVIQAGTRLEQGATYVNLNDLVAGPFTALGGHEVGPDDRIVAKRETDYELWDKVVGQGRTVKVERPETGRH